MGGTASDHGSGGVIVKGHSICGQNICVKSFVCRIIAILTKALRYKRIKSEIKICVCMRVCARARPRYLQQTSTKDTCVCVREKERNK